MALCTDGVLVAWGANNAGQLGNGGTSSSGRGTVVVNRGGVLAGKTIQSVAAGDSHSLALCSDGTVAAWGNNEGGRLGNNSTTTSRAPVVVDRTGVLAGKTVTAIAAGAVHNVALCTDGTLAAWGGNASGQLGNATRDEQSGGGAGESERGALRQGRGRNRCRRIAQSRGVRGRQHGDVGRGRFGRLGNGSSADSNVPVLFTA